MLGFIIGLFVGAEFGFGICALVMMADDDDNGPGDRGGRGGPAAGT